MTHQQKTNKHPGHSRLVILALAATLLCQAAAAQERWFQIEVLAFSRQTADQQEQWPTNIKPGYPLNTLELLDPEQPTEPATESDLLTAETEENSPLIEEAVKPDLERTPYLLLPANERKLTRQANTLERQGGYQVLFHQSWRQPVNSSTRNAPAIIIQGGSQYGQYNELEGSISFSLPQLLQVNTRLWLTRFEPNYGQEPGEWPALPKSPSRLRAELMADTSPSITPSLFGDTASDNSWFNSNTTLTTGSAEQAEPWLPQRIILLEEERRLRPGELHYIDHPLLGVIVQITPYELPPAATTNLD